MRSHARILYVFLALLFMAGCVHRGEIPADTSSRNMATEPEKGDVVPNVLLGILADASYHQEASDRLGKRCIAVNR